MCNEIKATVTERRCKGIEFSTEIEDMEFDGGITTRSAHRRSARR